MSTNKTYCEKTNKLKVIKYDFKELLNKGFKDLPTGYINNHYCFMINNKIEDIIVKQYSDMDNNPTNV